MSEWKIGAINFDLYYVKPAAAGEDPTVCLASSITGADVGSGIAGPAATSGIEGNAISSGVADPATKSGIDNPSISSPFKRGCT